VCSGFVCSVRFVWSRLEPFTRKYSPWKCFAATLSQAFRIVTSVPVVLLRTATKKIQEGLQGARERLSMGGASSSTGGNSSTVESAASHSHHHHIGKQIQEGILGLKDRAVRLSHMNSGSSHSQNRSCPSVNSKPNVQVEKDNDSTITLDGEEKNLMADSDSSGVLDGGARIVSIRRVHKMPSALSSTCSFASLSADDDLGIILSEDELDPNEPPHHSSLKSSPVKQTEVDGGDREVAESGETDPFDVATIEEEVETAPHQHHSNRKRLKRLKKTTTRKEISSKSKCTIQ
jgi:hypothetical protein